MVFDGQEQAIISNQTESTANFAVQRKFIKRLVGANVRSPTDLLFELLSMADIVDEIEIKIKAKSMNRADRREFKERRRNEILGSSNNNDEAINIDSISHRYANWYLLDTCRTKSFLYRIHKIDDLTCQY